MPEIRNAFHTSFKEQRVGWRRTIAEKTWRRKLAKKHGEETWRRNMSVHSSEMPRLRVNAGIRRHNIQRVCR